MVEVDTAPVVPAAAPHGWELGAPLAFGGSAHVFELVRGGERAVLKWARWQDAAIRRRFELEAAALAAVGPPLVPALQATAGPEQWPYLIVERLDGETLADWMARHAEHRVEEVIDVLDGLAATLGALHERGWVHRDLKPENVFLTARGVRLIDLGLAKSVRQAGTLTTGVVAGTAYYVAPEQLSSPGIADPCVDVYAFGAVAFEALVGRPPFVGERPAIEYGHLVCRAPRVRDLRSVPAELDELIDACLAKDARARPDGLPAIRAALARARAAPQAIATAPAAAAADAGAHGPVALVWAAGSPIAAVRAIEQTQGVVLRRVGDAVLGAFTWYAHDAPLTAALATAQAITAEGGRAVVHLADALVRPSPGRRTAVYGAEVNDPSSWLPPGPWNGLLISAAAARELAPDATAAADDCPGYARAVERDRTDVRDAVGDLTLVGRDGVITEVTAMVSRTAADGRPSLITVVGERGTGKSRIAAAVVRAARDAGWPTVEHAGRRRFGGDRGDDRDRLRDALGADLVEGLREAGQRGLVLVVDDAQWVDDELLDAVEWATSVDSGRLVAVVIADPELPRTRRGWGQRAAREALYTLLPLGTDDVRRLLREALRPARMIPEQLLERLATRGAGNPGLLVRLARELKRRGLVRRHPGSDEWYVAADEVDQVPPTPTVRWLAERELEGLPPGMGALLEAASVLGPRFDAGEIRVLQSDDAALVVEPSVGLGWLTRAGLLRDRDGDFEFTDPSVQDAVLDRIAGARRQGLHERALRHWLAREVGDPVERLGRLAHHAAGARHGITAATALIALAEHARRRHQNLEVERLLSRAIGILGDGAPAMSARALAGRGRARRLLTLYEEARADFSMARRLAERIGDLPLQVDMLVAEAAVCDFVEQLVESAQLIERARTLAPADLPPEVRCRLLNWLGVVRARQEQLDPALAHLNLAIALGDAVGDDETVAGSSLMLAAVLRRLDRVEDGLKVLDRVIARADRDGDHFHRAIGLFNRINFWRRLRDPERAERDCEEAIALAERHGFGQVEVWGWFNLADLRWWQGRLDAALDAARRSYEVGQLRFRDRPPIVGALQLAMLEAARGEHTRARALLGAIPPADAHQSPSLALVADTVGAALGDADEPVWTELLDRARRVGAEQDAVMVLWLRACAAASRRPTSARAAIGDAEAEARRHGAVLAYPAVSSP